MAAVKDCVIIHIRSNESLKERIRKAAKEDGRSMTQYLLRLLERNVPGGKG